MIHLKLPLYTCIVSTILVLQHVISQTNKYTDVMTKLSYSFGLALLECGDVANATKPMEEDVYNYWNVNYNLSHVSTGCLVLCAMAKLELLDGEGKLKRANAEGYIRATGGDDEIVSSLLNLYTKCRLVPTPTTHPCTVALEVSKCFRQGIHDHRWTPDISSLLSLNH